MRKGAHVRIKEHATYGGQFGTYVRRDMTRFMPFLIRLESGQEVWLAAVFLEEAPVQPT